MKLYSVENFNNLWGEHYLFHQMIHNDKIFLVIVEKNKSSDGTSFYLDFCTHKSFEEANETLYRLCFSNKIDKKLTSLLKSCGGGGDNSFTFYSSVITQYIKETIQENKKRSCINLLICNELGMSKIINFCKNNNFFFIGSCLTFRANNYISIQNRILNKKEVLSSL